MKHFILTHPYLSNSLLLAGALVFSVALGAVFIPPGTILKIIWDVFPGVDVLPTWSEAFAVIVLQLRLPHTVLIALTGAALAGSGASFQGLFRNPLADPYLIGVASGAGLGAVFMMAMRFPSDLLGMYFIPVGAFAGALVTVMVVYTLARVGKIVPLTTLILAGVAVGAFTSAMTSFLMLRSDGQIYRAIAFLLGGSSMTGWRPVLAALPYMAIGFLLLTLSGHVLNVLQFGEDQAKQLGLPVEAAKRFVIITASLTTAVAVSFSGVIGFVGLVVPHILRILWGPDYRRLIPLSLIAGASTLLMADMLSRVLLAPESLPVGIVTALAGAPFFLWILRKAKTEVFW
ncbi:MAG: iron ABC transporter permease [Oceanisphaera sp.]|nr:iron ABC transporter permease [Oceanisphaera sp.]